MSIEYNAAFPSVSTHDDIATSRPTYSGEGVFHLVTHISLWFVGDICKNLIYISMLARLKILKFDFKLMSVSVSKLPSQNQSWRGRCNLGWVYVMRYWDVTSP